MIKRIEEYSSMIDRLFYNPDKRVRSVTIQVTDACNLCCKYCYQHNKGKHFVDFETAKKYIDLILDGNNPYINMDNSCGMTLEFIGGEPLLAIDLMDQITEYTLNRLIKEQHPWLTRFRISICTNGVLYFDERVQAYLKKYKEFISFTVSIDGNKELHDSCRVFPDGKGSYDMAIAAAKHYMENYYKISTKMTLSPGNVAHTKAAIENLINIGYDQIHCNCVYEDGWTLEHARILYSQLKELANYLFDSGKYDDIYISIFEEDQFKPMGLDDDRNYCGGNGDMIAVDYKGDIFPCLRYMESSLGDNVEPIIIGNVNDGIEVTPKQRQWVKCLKCMTRTSQSTDECIHCPIAQGCSWCSALNYEVYGELNKRSTFICVMHKARALANVYFWNKYYRLMNMDKRMKCHVPKEWALDIISEEEYNYLLSLMED